ncbi:MAG: hypothetical protein MJZ11_08260 [Lachnospiraceae bacterium]|nr:hypothetical protein [Lachnospiraceae bacterium]
MDNDYVLYYIPSTNQTIYCYEGSGDNLLEEDREQGLNDYVNYSVMPGRVEPSAFEEDEYYDETVGDGGMYMFNNEDTRYRSMEFAVRMVIQEMMDMDFDTPIEFVGNVEI